MMRKLRIFTALTALVLAIAAAGAADFEIIEVPSITSAEAGRGKSHTIAFTDHRHDELADPATGLIAFDSWARAMPVEKQLLSPYPGYVEPTVSVTVNGVVKQVKDKLHMYVAEARFVLLKPPQSMALTPTKAATLLERIDPAISHRIVPSADGDNSSNAHPDRRWCEGKVELLCIQSKYELEGKLPTAIHLLNKLFESKKKIADYLQFQSELRILKPADLDLKKLATLTGIDAPIIGGFEQTIFHINQVMQFGKFLCIFQQDAADPNRTLVSAFIALAIKTRVLDKQKKYESVPVLRNLIPSQVLVGNSSFNTGSSLSAGLPKYARNQVKAVAALLEHD
jgi:hypothetical protein